MYWGLADHPPPHFHAYYQGQSASINILTGDMIEGRLPRRQYRLVREWLEQNRAAMLDNWQRAQQTLPLLPVPPLA